MKQIILLGMIILFSLASCKKEKFPEMDELTGSWIEQTNNSFKHKLIFESETMYFLKPLSTDTLIYRLDKEQELIYLRLKNNHTAGESNHKSLINKKKKELTIWGLLVGTNTSETLFKKE